jgi:hypothetical protein
MGNQGQYNTSPDRELCSHHDRVTARHRVPKTEKKEGVDVSRTFSLIEKELEGWENFSPDIGLLWSQWVGRCST